MPERKPARCALRRAAVISMDRQLVSVSRWSWLPRMHAVAEIQATAIQAMCLKSSQVAASLIGNASQQLWPGSMPSQSADIHQDKSK